MYPEESYDPFGIDEEEWIAKQRNRVAVYLATEGVRHGEVGDWPAWCQAPHLAVWGVESIHEPGLVSWWVVSGDGPTDYVSVRGLSGPRDALRHFARQWADVAAHMLRGEPHPDITIGSPDRWPELGNLLEERSHLLSDFADDDTLWE